ncbi:MAG: 16S rRNA (guanine(966)-N(2))-methyltransferase RsmD [Elusimicrobia bacterium CG08_land_8_20_14_0_20_51_18]|nr:MAG: 16S rRNA (guanine(966)-N(2))-methyltransferase RsmD [Elusimicrobia bacterium CG08_land_8_20_14_0_20_51_18]
MIRIIAGAKKNRRILSLPASHHVKPISVRMRKSVFDIIRPNITGSLFLDLYAGVGAVGLEALSRGAGKVVFVDSDRRCLDIIKKNLENLELKENAVVAKGDILKGLIWLKYYSPEGYDIVYMGPPYRDRENNPLSYSSQTIKMVAEEGLLSEYGFIVAQHHGKEIVQVPESLVVYRTQKYGDTNIDFIKPRKPAASPLPPQA